MEWTESRMNVCIYIIKYHLWNPSYIIIVFICLFTKGEKSNSERIEKPQMPGESEWISGMNDRKRENLEKTPRRKIKTAVKKILFARGCSLVFSSLPAPATAFSGFWKNMLREGQGKIQRSKGGHLANLPSSCPPSNLLGL